MSYRFLKGQELTPRLNALTPRLNAQLNDTFNVLFLSHSKISWKEFIRCISMGHSMTLTVSFNDSLNVYLKHNSH
jgi:hypothetical protein